MPIGRPKRSHRWVSFGWTQRERLNSTRFKGFDKSERPWRGLGWIAVYNHQAFMSGAHFIDKFVERLTIAGCRLDQGRDHSSVCPRAPSASFIACASACGRRLLWSDMDKHASMVRGEIREDVVHPSGSARQRRA